MKTRLTHATGYYVIVAIKKIKGKEYCELESYTKDDKLKDVPKDMLLWPLEHVQEILDNDCLIWRRTL